MVILVGSKLVGWIGRKKNLDFLTASTRVQLKMGQEVSEAVTSAKELGETILKCLTRDPDWVAYHASELAEAAHAIPMDEVALKVAAVERRVFKLQRLGRYEGALADLEKILHDDALASDRQRLAWIAAAAARIAFQMEDENTGQKYQTTAFSGNNNHSPPRKRPAYVARPAPSKQARAIVRRLLQYDQRAAIIADFDEAMSDLAPQASTSRYEDALAKLGGFLGFDAERPEKIHGVGPDVLWRTDGAFDFVIEAKSRKNRESPLYKKDHAQLLQAEHWFKQVYTGRAVVRVSALPEALADKKATPAGSFALRLDDIGRMVNALRGVLIELVHARAAADDLHQRCEADLRNAKLTPEKIREDFMKPFGTA